MTYYSSPTPSTFDKENNARLDLYNELDNELNKAYRKFPDPMPSAHHGKAVIQEELDELWDEIKADRGRTDAARQEALQVAAMALRYILDLANPWEHLGKDKN